jgi:hypothetical protein
MEPYITPDSFLPHAFQFINSLLNIQLYIKLHSNSDISSWLSRLTYFGLGGGGGSRTLERGGGARAFVLKLKNHVKPVLRKDLK